jgi:transposase-like protein
MPRSSIAPEKKEHAMDLIRAGKLSTAAIARETGVGEMTIANWRRKDNEGGGEGERKVNLKEQVETLSTELKLVRLTNKYLRRYAKAEGGSNQKEVEIDYLMARAQVFGDVTIKRLAEEQDEDEEGESEETE